MATQDRFEATRKVSDRVVMESRWGKHREERSYLSEFLDIVNGAGGWKTVTTPKTAYQQADARTMLRVVLEAWELREAK